MNIVKVNSINFNEYKKEKVSVYIEGVFIIEYINIDLFYKRLIELECLYILNGELEGEVNKGIVKSSREILKSSMVIMDNGIIFDSEIYINGLDGDYSEVLNYMNKSNNGILELFDNKELIGY